MPPPVRRPRARDRARRRRHDPPCGGTRPRQRCPGARHQHGPRRLPRGDRPGRHGRRDAPRHRPRLRGRGAPGAVGAGEGRLGRRRLRDLGSERGDRREGEPGAHDRGGARDRRAAAVELRLRRHGRLHPDRLDRLQLLRRRPGHLADGRGHRRRPAVGPCPLRQAARGEPRRGRGDRDAGADGRLRHPLVRRPSFPRPSAGCPRRRPSFVAPGPPRATAPHRVHESSRPQVPAARRGWRGQERRSEA